MSFEGPGLCDGLSSRSPTLPQYVSSALHLLLKTVLGIRVAERRTPGGAAGCEGKADQGASRFSECPCEQPWTFLRQGCQLVFLKARFCVELSHRRKLAGGKKKCIADTRAETETAATFERFAILNTAADGSRVLARPQTLDVLTAVQLFGLRSHPVRTPL